MAAYGSRLVKGEVPCPVCGDTIRVQTLVTMSQLGTPDRVSVHVSPIRFVHKCPAVVPARRRRAAE